jgi:hypothetical protein
MCSGERLWRRPYGTPDGLLVSANATLKRGANNHCAYGAVAPALRNVARKMRGSDMELKSSMTLLMVFALFTAGTAMAQPSGTNPVSEHTIFGDAESFKNSVPLPRNVLDVLIAPMKDDKYYRDFVVGKSDKDLNKLFTGVVMNLSGANEVDYIIEGNLPFAGADNAWFWVVRTGGLKPIVVLNEGASFLELLNSRTNGYRDIRSVWVMSGTKRIRVYHYDGSSYTLFNTVETSKP